jgi:hypothetical protein
VIGDLDAHPAEALQIGGTQEQAEPAVERGLILAERAKQARLGAPGLGECEA